MADNKGGNKWKGTNTPQSTKRVTPPPPPPKVKTPPKTITVPKKSGG